MLSEFPIFSTIIGLESGTISNNFPLNLCKDWGKTFSSPKKIIKNHSDLVTQPKSEIIYLEGKENILITLDSKGRIVCHNTITDSKSNLLTSPNEHAYKAFFVNDLLFFALKDFNDDSLKFYTIYLEDLQNFDFERKNIFCHLKINLGNIKEILKEFGIIVIEINNTIQLWDIINDRFIKQFPLNPNYQYQITSGKFVIWEVEKNETNFGIIDLQTNFFESFTITGTQKIYLCEIKGNQLIIGMLMCHLQVINLESKNSKIINKGVPKFYYLLEGSESTVAIYNDGSAVMIGTEIFEFSLGRQEFFSCYINGGIIFCEKSGKIKILEKKKLIEIKCAVKNLQQIGVNRDTNEIFLTSRGTIYIYE